MKLCRGCGESYCQDCDVRAKYLVSKGWNTTYYGRLWRKHQNPYNELPVDAAVAFQRKEDELVEHMRKEDFLTQLPTTFENLL